MRILPDGRIIITGTSNDVADIEDAISLLEEDTSVGEVIRIFRFRYGDVNAAAEILDRMFNERQVVQRQPQPQQQQPGRGREGERGANQQQQNLLEQMQQMAGQRTGRGGRTFQGRARAHRHRSQP